MTRRPSGSPSSTLSSAVPLVIRVQRISLYFRR
jgi:hypothetical protein